MDVFRMNGHDRHRIRLRLGMLAHNLLVEEYPLAERDLAPDGESHWLLETEVAGFAGVARFVAGLLLSLIHICVPCQRDTLWLECTNTDVPFGYVHQSIAGHDAVICHDGKAEVVTLPAYADSLNTECKRIDVRLDEAGNASLSLSSVSRARQYEWTRPILDLARDKQAEDVYKRQEHIHAFVRRTHTTDQMVFSSIGNIAPRRIEAIAARYFADMPATVRSFCRTAPAPVAPFERSIARHTHQSHCIVGARAYGCLLYTSRCV